MGTRGAFGVVFDGVTKASYNHFDSYPSGLGEQVLRDLKAILHDPTQGEAWLIDRARTLQLVDEDAKPTPMARVALAAFTDVNVSIGDDWYSVLRGLQGELRKTLDVGVMLDYTDFLKDSLFCEWAYLVNCDSRELEIYEGFQSKRHTKGRYATRWPKPKDWKPQYDGQEYYYPVACIAAVSWYDLPESIADILPKEASV